MPDDPENTASEPSESPDDALSDAERAMKNAADEVDRSGQAADDGAAAALAAAMSAIRMTQNAADEAVTQALESPPSPRPGRAPPDLKDAVPLSLTDLAAAIGSGKKETLDLLSDVQLSVRIELGRTRMYVEDILQLGDGAVVELDKLAGDPVDVFVNERHVARGEVLVLNDNFCVRINEILDPGQTLLDK